MAARVDINEFSLNAFYRNRLVRCYLGATRFQPGERASAELHRLRRRRRHGAGELAAPQNGREPAASHRQLRAEPGRIERPGAAHAAQRVVHADPAALRQRLQSRTQAGEKQEIGYVPTADYGGTVRRADARTGDLGVRRGGQPEHGLPHVAGHRVPADRVQRAARLVVPQSAQVGARFPSPHFNLSYLFAELFGGANDKSKFLMISDGGHFENLAAYELIKRAASVIIISDAECDPELTFEGLGTLIRMCEVDFGARSSSMSGSIRPARDRDGAATAAPSGRIVYADGRTARSSTSRRR